MTRLFAVLVLAFSLSCMASEQVRLNIDESFISTKDSWAAIEPLWWSVSIYDGLDRYERDLKNFSSQQRHVFACHWYLAEVNNGGHDQFYSNSTGIVWRDALLGFRAMGLPQFAEIIAESARRMGGSPSFDRDERNAVLDKKRPPFDDLDNRLYEAEKKVNIEEAMNSYVRKNHQAFRFSGVFTKP